MKLLFLSLSILFFSILHAQDWKMLSQQVDTMIYKGEYKKAIPFAEQSVFKIKSVLGENNEPYIKSQENLAELYIIMDFYSKADSVLKYSLLLIKRMSGDDSAAYAPLLLKLGILYKRKADYANAENYLNQSLRITSKLVGKVNTEYAKTLSELGNMYADKGDLVNAQRCLEEALKIQGNETSIKYADYAQTLTYLGWLYSSMSKEEEAETVHKLALEIRKEVFGERHPYYAQSLNAVAGILTDKKEYVKAEQFYEQARIIRKEAYGEEHSFYANIINNLGRIYLILKDYRKAESFFLEVMSIRKKVFGENHPEYANILNSLAILYKNMKEYDKAEKYYLEALSIRKKVLGENHPEYTNILNSLAIIYDNMKEYGKAKEYYLEELSIRKRVFGENHSDYANVLNSLGIIYQNLKEYQKAETVYLEALLVRKKVHGENHVDYATVLFNLSNLYKLMKEYARAEMSCLQVLSIRKQVLGENHPDYARAHKFIGLLYLDMGKYSNAEQSLYEAKNIFDRIHGRYNYESHLLNKSLVSYYFNVGKHSRAEVLILESLETIKNLKGDISLDYAYVLRELIHFNTAMGQYDKALKHYETQRRIVNINKAQIRDVDYYYLLLTEGLTVYANNGKNNEAEEIGKEVVSLSKKLFGDSSYNYAVSLADLSKLYIYKFGLRYYPKGEELLIDALKVFEKHFGENSPRYCSYERELAILYYLQGKFDFAEAIFDKLNKRSVELWGDLGPNRIDILKRMAELYAVKREFDKAGRYQLKAAEKEFSYMLSDFVNLSEAEKTKYLNRIDINEKTNSLIYNNPGASSEIKESGFNFQLLFKSFILADTRNIIESIERGTDTILKRTYRKWKDGKAFIAQQYSLPESKRVANLKMVIDETELAEKELNRNSSSFRRQQQAMQVKIQDVADALKSDEAAIEFVKFSLFNKKWKDTAFVYSDSVIYAAYVLTKRISTPVFVPLFEEKQLQKLFDSAGTSSDAMVSKFYRGVELGNTGTAASLGKDLYNLVWAPLEPYLKGIKKISYSPAGKLYSIAFHALPVDSNKMLMDKYELNQYTSTRQVALRKKQEENRKP